MYTNVYIQGNRSLAVDQPRSAVSNNNFNRGLHFVTPPKVKGNHENSLMKN